LRQAKSKEKNMKTRYLCNTSSKVDGAIRSIRKHLSSQANVRFLSSSSSSSSGSYTVNMPSKPTSTWERSAKNVKNTDTSNQYLEHIRAVHDPSMHIKTIEDELKGTIGKALGKQGDKILLALRCMKQEKIEYDNLLQSHNDLTNDFAHRKKIHDCVLRYNDFRKQAEKARWELLVHRQAAGFIVNNHKIVYEKFPIGNPLPVINLDEGSNSDCRTKISETEKKTPQKFGDQLDWWQRIGRWR